MSPLSPLTSCSTWTSHISTAYLALGLLLLMPLGGCSGDGAEGPIISSLSTLTDATGGWDSDQAPDSAAAAPNGEEDPIISMTPTATGVTAHVTWDRPPDINVASYTIYYGKRSTKESRSEASGLGESEPNECFSGEIQTVEAPPATIVGLEPDTPYVFVIRAFNESESLCSNEITVKTPPAES